jgi:hypothetical protein
MDPPLQLGFILPQITPVGTWSHLSRLRRKGYQGDGLAM